MVIRISWQGILIRFVIALVLVFFTYNPHGISYFHWLTSYFSPATESKVSLPVLVLVGVILLIVWTIYIRATMRSLGMFGLLLASAFFGALLWLVIDLNWVSFSNKVVILDIILVIIAGVLAVGISWSHIRRRISGQADVDDVDE
jgi:hypothetical protein